MSEFDFDSESNVISSRIPSIKVINKMFCGHKGMAGLWIANDNLLACKWKKNCDESCEKTCTLHFISTSFHSVSTANDDEIGGQGILNPRMSILRRSKLIKLRDGYYAGLWDKKDRDVMDEKDNNKKKYVCARRYLIMFFDKKNKPLHECPIQLTAKGTFLFNFDTSYMTFRNECRQSYNKSMGRRDGTMNEQWYTMFIFIPTFESKKVGKDQQKSSDACFVKTYEIPTCENWLTMCIGRDTEIKSFVSNHFINSESWIENMEKKPSYEKNYQRDDDNISIISDF